MILYPAIDILDGGAVRLARGEFDQRTRYDADPLDAALRWVRAGARALHVVDLDGTRAGAPANVEHVRRITAAVDVPVQVAAGCARASRSTRCSTPVRRGSCSGPPRSTMSSFSTTRSPAMVTG